MSKPGDETGANFRLPLGLPTSDNSCKLNLSGASKRGKHKIFIGMAPGVGKTYRMLEEAHCLKQDGIDVVIGVLEDHGRKETAHKAEKLEQISLAQVAYQNRLLAEMDTEAILVRRPQVVLVDELAHTNVPGSVRQKRCEDVEMLLTAGITVYSTVNVQHLESLNDVVARITGVLVRERIPDRILEDADAVVVVDVTPETLEERLNEGKIYALEKVPSARANFFKHSNLVALRELALRTVANQVEDDYQEGNGNPAEFTGIHERILVCVSTYPSSIRLLRQGARLASRLDAELYTLFVQLPNRFLSREEAMRVETCERLTQEFGGTFLRQEGADIAKIIASVVQERCITHVVLGESKRSRWEMLFKGSLVYKLMPMLKTTNLHIVRADAQ